MLLENNNNIIQQGRVNRALNIFLHVVHKVIFSSCPNYLREESAAGMRSLQIMEEFCYFTCGTWSQH